MSDLIRYHGDSKVINRLCELVNNMTSINFEVVQTLPTQDISTSTIYLVPKQSAETDNIYDEYINTDGTSQGWELIGTTEIDLSNYYTKTEVDNLIPTDFVPKSTGGVFDGNVEIVTANSGTSNVNSIFRLGNNKAVGVLGNTRGVIQIYDRNGNYTNIFASDNTSSGNIYLPNDKPTNSVLAVEGYTAVYGELSTENLNDVKTTGFYTGIQGNTCTNKPSGVIQFGLMVIKTASTSSNYKQALTTPQGLEYVRYCTNNVWSAWTQL